MGMSPFVLVMVLLLSLLVTKGIAVLLVMLQRHWQPSTRLPATAGHALAMATRRPLAKWRRRNAAGHYRTQHTAPT